MVKRAKYVRSVQPSIWKQILDLSLSQLLSTDQLTRLLDEEMTEQELEELQQAEDVCRKLMAWDMDTEDGDTKSRLGEVLRR